MSSLDSRALSRKRKISSWLEDSEHRPPFSEALASGSVQLLADDRNLYMSVASSCRICPFANINTLALRNIRELLEMLLILNLMINPFFFESLYFYSTYTLSNISYVYI